MRSDSQQQGGTSVMSSNKEDDEDELEALRLAALESLRAKGLPPPVLMSGQQHLSPKHVIPSNPIFQRHFGNQNLIAIIPVEQSSASSSPYQNSSPHHHHHPPLIETKGVPACPPRSSTRPPLLSTPPSSTLTTRNQETLEEKPKHTTKFSRFDDSDSDESEDDLPYTKSESEEEEFIVEEGEADDLIIEVEDEIVDEVVIEEFIEDDDTPSSADIPDDKTTTTTRSSSDSFGKSSTAASSTNTPPRVPIEAPKEESLARDAKSVDTNRRIDSVDPVKRSPRSGATRSPPYSRRRSPPRRSPPRVQRSPVLKSPSRSQRSPPSRARSPPLRAQRSPVRGYRSPLRVQRSPPRTQRSPPRNQRSPIRSARSPVRSSDRDKLKHKDGKSSSGSERSVSDEVKKNDKLRSSTATTDQSNHRPSSDHRRATDRSRSPLIDRKPLARRSPPRSILNDRESRKLATPSPTDSEKDRLELRKRKFELASNNEPSLKKEGKIRLRTETTRPPSPVQVKRKDDKPKRSETELIRVRREEPMSMIDDKSTEEEEDKKLKKSSKRPSKKSKDKIRSKKLLGETESDSGSVIFSNKNDESTTDAHIDLRAELQRRRVNRYDEPEEPRSRTPETRRILVLNSPPPSSAVPVSKSSTEPTGVLSKHQRLVADDQTKPSSTESLAIKSKRNGSVKLKRTLLAAPIEIDQGTETDPLEDRIRLIRAQNELIRKRQREIEADKLQYA